MHRSSCIRNIQRWLYCKMHVYFQDCTLDSHSIPANEMRSSTVTVMDPIIRTSLIESTICESYSCCIINIIQLAYRCTNNNVMQQKHCVHLSHSYNEKISDGLWKSHRVERASESVGERKHHTDGTPQLRTQSTGDHEVCTAWRMEETYEI